MCEYNGNKMLAGYFNTLVHKYIVFSVVPCYQILLQLTILIIKYSGLPLLSFPDGFPLPLTLSICFNPHLSPQQEDIKKCNTTILIFSSVVA